LAGSVEETEGVGFITDPIEKMSARYLCSI
jgi:hypothetical protein